MGPMLGAIVMLVSCVSLNLRFWISRTYAKDIALTKEPLSAGEAMSFTTPYAIEKVPENISLEPESRDKRARNCQSL